MTHTSDMVKAYVDGYEIVVSFGPIYSGRKDGKWPVMYVPRWPQDPRPFAMVGEWNGMCPRYSGGELTALPTAGQKHT